MSLKQRTKINLVQIIKKLRPIGLARKVEIFIKISSEIGFRLSALCVTVLRERERKL